MRFLHLSDTHLGYRQYNLADRERDFWEVFEEAVELAIERSVDFILHSGDFFHTSRPSNNTLLRAIDLIKRLNDFNIPIFCISGNHDRGSHTKDKSPLAILENLGLNLLDDKRYISFDGVGIVGLKYLSRVALRKVELSGLLENMASLGNDDIKLLMLHQEFKPYFQDTELDLFNDIPDIFSYVGIGHYHIATEPLKRNNSTIVHVGSTEFTAYNPREEVYPKKVAIVEIDSNKNTNVEFYNLKRVRPFIYTNVEEDNLDKAVSEILERYSEKKSDKKPVLVLKGALRNKTATDIMRYIQEKLDTELFLTIKANFNFIVDGNSESVSIKDLRREDFIRNKLKELIGDENLFSEVYGIIEQLKTAEDLNIAKEELKRIDFEKILEQ